MGTSIARIRMGRVVFTVSALCLLFSGCGSGPVSSFEATSGASSSGGSVSFTGIYVDKAYTDLLEQDFQRTVECTTLQGNFWDVAVFLYPPPQFECTGTNNQGKACYGEFLKPNKVLLARSTSWKHEVIHYLLYKNTGDLDPDHQSDLFGKCG